MDTSNLYDFLLRAVKRNAMYLITFEDGDKYTLDKVDFCYSVGLDGKRDDETVRVNFDDCLNDSCKRMQAFRDGQVETPGVLWTSVSPIEPVGMDYHVQAVATIWDQDKCYIVYDRNDDQSMSERQIAVG